MVHKLVRDFFYDTVFLFTVSPSPKSEIENVTGQSKQLSDFVPGKPVLKFFADFVVTFNAF